MTCLALGALTACGGDDASSDDPQKAIRALFADTRKAFEDEDYDAVCEQLTAGTKQEIGGDCPDQLERVTELSGENIPLPLGVERIEPQGEGKAIVRSPEGDETKVIRQDGRWRFAADSEF